MENEPSKGWRTRASTELKQWVIINENDEIVAILPGFDSMENAGKRAELFQKAPELVNTLCDVLEIALREVPEHLQEKIKTTRNIVSTIRR